MRETAGISHRLPSGPLHDAAEVARPGIPTVMMFTQSLAGLSHNKVEDTTIDDLKMAVEAFDRLAKKTMTWLSAKRVEVSFNVRKGISFAVVPICCDSA